MSRLVEIFRAFGSVLAALGCAVAATGCYSYQMVAPTAVSPGTRIRAHLSNEGLVRLEPVLGGFQREVEGEVIEATEGQLLLLARTGLTLRDNSAPFLDRQRIVIEQEELLRVEERRLERTRSAAFTAFVGSALVGAAVYFFTGRSRGRGVRGPSDGPEL